MLANRSVKWIALAFSAKLVLSALLFINLGYGFEDFFKAICIGDCISAYSVGANNILNLQQYTIYNDLSPYTGRMPGYELLMAATGLFNGFQSIDFRVLFFIQLLAASLSTYALGRTAELVFNKSIYFYMVFFLYLVSSYVSLYDITALSESMCISLFIISFYILLRYNQSKTYLLSGLLLTLCVFLRQYTLPFFAIFLIYICYIHQFKISRVLVYNMLLFVLPFIVLDSAWVIRNYKLKGEFIFLVDSNYAGYNTEQAKGSPFYFSAKDEALAAYISSWGGDLIWWNSNAEITAFKSTAKLGKERKREILNGFPDYIYTSTYNYDSLVELQNKYLLYDTLNDHKIIDSFERYRASFIAEKPFYHYVYAPLILTKKFLFHSGTYNLSNTAWADQNLYQKANKLFYSGLYLLIVWLGLIGTIMLLRQFLLDLDYRKLMIVMSAMYIVGLLPVVFKRIEYRHFTFAYPYFIIVSAHVMLYLRSKLISKVRK
ncbi:hypothetical protein [Reichenbachiella sp.]